MGIRGNGLGVRTFCSGVAVCLYSGVATNARRLISIIRGDGLRDHTLAGLLWEGYRERRRCSRDTYPESYITNYTNHISFCAVAPIGVRGNELGVTAWRFVAWA